MVISEKPLLFAAEAGLKMPSGYLDAKALGLVNLMPWQFVTDDEFDWLFSGLASRYPVRKAIPFARRRDNDDVACFTPGGKGLDNCEVTIIHDFATSGSEVVAEFDTFWGWFQYAVGEMVEWHEGSE